MTKLNFSIIREVLQDMRDMETFESREKGFLNNRPTADDAFRNLEEVESEIARLKDALIWCSGSADFGPGGQAEEGWNKVCRPLLGIA